MNLRANGAAIRVIRVRTGISQTDFAARCEVDQATISNIERGVRNPGPALLRRIADELGVPLESISYLQPDAAPAGSAA